MELGSVSYRHNECLGLQLFIVKNKPSLAAAELAPGFRRAAKEDPIVLHREILDLLAIASAQGGFRAGTRAELGFQVQNDFDDPIEARSFFDLVGALPFLESPRQLGQAQNARKLGFRERTHDLGIRAAEGFGKCEFHKSCCSGLDI